MCGCVGDDGVRVCGCDDDGYKGRVLGSPEGKGYYFSEGVFQSVIEIGSVHAVLHETREEGKGGKGKGMESLKKGKRKA